ncbi:RHS repeat-associated core domain-containing protein [Variovorax sp. PBL-E5]|uniref:RHS repeat-associated core domain-containing protein n=1 Tax=Variovorax sp. PBL-E5 TaxID=434014 RepID=UPI00131752C4|nr:RHS repeat-associated core domain-containing protein [Variovorax sp. PBL-E5]VTU39415.1 RHS repeat-associated core domain protein [Variovorax sp. PBL-E5]
MPIAAVINGQIYAIHSDHLNTPQRIDNARGQTVWQWAYSPFGDTKPTTAHNRFANLDITPNPATTGISEVVFNLRHPGQYYDKESRLFDNYFRGLDPKTGRYTQADPKGLDAGPNRYPYANLNPLSYIDPYRLWSLTFGAYAGPGGQVTFGNAGGNGFVTGRVGLGLGGGFSYNPAGGLPGEAPNDPSKGGIVAACSAKASLNAGPLQTNVELGGARNYNNDTSTWLSPFSANGRFSNGWLGGGSIWNLSANANIGAQLTVYGGR